jgi:hypothetical protein
MILSPAEHAARSAQASAIERLAGARYRELLDDRQAFERVLEFISDTDLPSHDHLVHALVTAPDDAHILQAAKALAALYEAAANCLAEQHAERRYRQLQQEARLERAFAAEEVT